LQLTGRESDGFMIRTAGNKARRQIRAGGPITMANFNYSAAEYQARESFIQNELNGLGHAITVNAHAVLGNKADRFLWNYWVAIAPAKVKARYEVFRKARTALVIGEVVDDASIGFE
jgi:hypothetical protein